MRMVPVIAMFAATAVITSPGAAQAWRPLTDSPELADLSQRWSEITDLFDVPGAAVVVVKDGELYIETFGVRDPESGAPVTPETMFYIASITKTYNAAAICKLAADGKLSLDDRLKDHLPQFDIADDAIESSVTIRDLLCHAKGINCGPCVTLDAYTGEITEDRYYHWLSRETPSGETDYTNVHYTLLGRVVESITGMDWRDYLDQEILTPAGLARTTGYASELYGDANAAIPSERAGGEFRPVKQRKTDRTMHAAGGLGTSAIDAGRWLLLHLSDGEIDGARILPADLARSMRQTHSRFDEPEGTIRIMEGFGLGWKVGRFNKRRLCAHGGGYAGTGAYFAILPGDDIGVGVLVNGSGPAGAFGDIVVIDALERLTGEEAAWDVYDNYTRRVREMKAERAEQADDKAAQPSGVAAAALSRPIGLYAGLYRNEHLGTIVFEREGDHLTMRLGDAPLDVAASGRDTFETTGGFDIRGQFILSDTGWVTAVRLDIESYGALVFHR